MENLNLFLELLKILNVSGHEDSINRFILNKIDLPSVVDKYNNIIVEHDNPMFIFMAHKDSIGGVIEKRGDILVGRKIGRLTSSENSKIKIRTEEKILNGIVNDDKILFNPNKKKHDEGEVFSYNGEIKQNKNNITSGTLDNKIGIFILLELIKSKYPATFIFTSQEELNSFGSKNLKINIDVPIISIDTTFSKNSIVPFNKNIIIGQGPVFTQCKELDTNLFNRFIYTAKKSTLNYQIEFSKKIPGADIDSIKETYPDTKVNIISVPIDNMHSHNETVNINDIYSTIKIIKNLLNKRIK